MSPQTGLELMLAELQSSELRVELVPQRVRTNEGGCIRVACSKNAKWYRDFCGKHLSCRKRKNLASDTRIKRANAIKTLETMISKGGSTSKYAPEFIRIAARYSQNPF